MISPSASQETDFAGAKHYWVFEERTNIQANRVIQNDLAYFPANYYTQKLGHHFFWTYSKDATVSFVSDVLPDGSPWQVPQWQFPNNKKELSAKLETPHLSFAPTDLSWKYTYDFHLRVYAAGSGIVSFNASHFASCNRLDTLASVSQGKLNEAYHAVNVSQGWNDVIVKLEFSSANFNAFKKTCDQAGRSTTQFIQFNSVDLSKVVQLKFIGAQVGLSDLRLLGSSPPPTVQVIQLPEPKRIWDLRSDCNENADTYWLCQSKEVHFPAERVSSTENSLIKNLLFVNTLTYRYSCPKAKVKGSTQVIEQPLEIFIDSQKIAASPNDITFNTPVPYTASSYVFGIHPSPSANLWPECFVEVVDNTTTAHIETLKAYKQLLQLNASFYSAIAENLSGAATIEGQAAEIVNVPIFLENQNAEILANIQSLTNEKLLLETIVNRTSYENQRLSDVAVLISNKQNELAQNQQLLIDIAEGLSAYQECGGGLCAQKINDLSRRLETLYGAFSTQLQELQDFLDAEIKRLEVRIPTYANQLKSLYCSGSVASCKYLKEDGSFSTWQEANQGSTTGGGSSGGGSTGTGGGSTGGGGTGGGTLPPPEDLVSDPYSKQSSTSETGKVYQYIEDRPGLATDFGTSSNRKYFPKQYYGKYLDQYPFWVYGSHAVVGYEPDRSATPTSRNLPTFSTGNKPFEAELLIHLPDFESLVSVYANWTTIYNAFWNVKISGSNAIVWQGMEVVGICQSSQNLTLKKEILHEDQAAIEETSGLWLQFQSRVELNQAKYTSFVSSCLLQLGKPYFTLKQQITSSGNVALQFVGISETYNLPANPQVTQTTLQRESSAITNVSVFNVKADCRFHQGTYNNCPNVNFKLNLDKPSITSDVFIQSLVYTSRINYQFRCNKVYKDEVANPVAQNIDAYFNQQKISPSSTVVTKESPAYYFGSAVEMKTIVQPQTIFWPECHYTVLSNITYPHLNSLAAYKNFLKESSGLYLNLNRQFDMAEELPAQWSVIANLPKIVDYQILKNKQDIQFTQQQINQLTALSNPSPEASQHLAMLRDYLSDLTESLVQNQERKTNLTDIISRTSTCQNATDAFCLNSLVEARNIVNAYANTTKQRIVHLEDFLLDEIARLQSRESQVAALFKSYFCELQTTTCNPAQSVEVLRDKFEQQNPSVATIPDTVLTGGKPTIEDWKTETVTKIETSEPESIPMPETIQIPHPFANYQRGVPEVDQKYDALIEERNTVIAMGKEEFDLRREIKEARDATEAIERFRKDHGALLGIYNAASQEINALIPQIKTAVDQENSAKIGLETWLNQASSEVFRNPPPVHARLLEIEKEFRQKFRSASFCYATRSSELMLKALELYNSRITVTQRDYKDLAEGLALPEKYAAPKTQAQAVLAKINQESQRYFDYFKSVGSLRSKPTVCNRMSVFELVLNFAKERSYLMAAGVDLQALSAQSLFESVTSAAEAIEMETQMRRYLIELEGRFYRYLTDGKLTDAASISDNLHITTALFARMVLDSSYWTTAQKTEFLKYMASVRERIGSRKHADLDKMDRLQVLAGLRSSNLHAELSDINSRFGGQPGAEWQGLLDWTLATLNMRPGSPYAVPTFTDRAAVILHDEKLSELENRIAEFRTVQALPCGDVAHGAMATRTRYATASVPYGSSCESEVQQALCTAGSFGAWSGTHAFESCSVEPPASCGGIAHNATDTRIMYATASAAESGSCLAETQVRTCSNGTFGPFTGTFAEASCTETRSRYSFVSPTGTCNAEVQSRTLTNGSAESWSGTFTLDSCTESRIRYASSAVAYGSSCQSETQTRTYSAGTVSAWSGTFAQTSCAVLPPANCGSLAHGGTESRTMFLASSVPYGQTCSSESQTRTCNNGTLSQWSGTFAQSACTVSPPLSCGAIAHGGTESRTMFQSSSVPYGQTCSSESQTRTCDNGIFGAWSGTYAVSACTVSPPLSCGSVAHGGTESRTMYEASSVPYGQTCRSEVQTRSCSNGSFGTWTGTYAFASCAPEPDPATSDKDLDGIVARDDCNDNNSSVWRILVRDNDQDGFFLTGSEFCGSQPTTTTLVKTADLVADNNDSSAAVTYDLIKKTINEATVGDWNLNGTANQTFTVAYIANTKQWMDLVTKCSDTTTTPTSCAAYVKLTRDIDFTNVATIDTAAAIHRAKCDMNFDGDTVDTTDLPCLDISNVKYALSAPAKNKRFTGVIDGSGYAIKGLRYNLSTKNEVGGIVRSTFGATIRDISFENSAVRGSGKVGGVVGWVDGGSLYKIKNAAFVRGSTSVGGVVGEINASNTSSAPLRSVSLMINAGDVSSIYNGLCGIGGVVGTSGGLYLGANLSLIGNTGKVTATSCGWVGGAVGLLDDRSSLANAYNTGAVSGKTSVGGLVGLVGTDVTGISKSYNIGSVVGTTYIGGYIGELPNTIVASGLWSKVATAPTTLKGLGRGTASSQIFERTRPQMYQKATFTGFDFVGETTNGTADHWTMVENTTTPMFSPFSANYKVCPSTYPQPGTCAP